MFLDLMFKINVLALRIIALFKHIWSKSYPVASFSQIKSQSKIANKLQPFI